MKLCIPVAADQGLDSAVFGHFGSAPLFMIVDTDTETCEPLENKNQHHQHGMCQPVAALNGVQVDGMIVGGIGRGALMKLNAAGIQVFHSSFATVGETLTAYKNQQLPVFTMEMGCGGHGHGQSGCGH